MNFAPISDSAARQSIDAVSIWNEYQRAAAAAKSFAGGMYWKKEGAYKYLVKTLAGNKQQRMGARTEETEQAFEAFHAQKKAAEARLSSLTKALDEAQRQNKALRVGRAPDILVKLLNALADAGLERCFRVVGTHALFAYESNAGVRITARGQDFQGLDPLSGAKRGVELLVNPECSVASALAVLKKVDPSFQLGSAALKNECAISGKGFEVGLLRLGRESGDSGPVALYGNEGRTWELSARRVAVFSRAPLFSEPVISATGKMATMNTIDPQSFVEGARLLASSDGSHAVTSRLDAVQAAVVQEMLETKLLSSVLD